MLMMRLRVIVVEAFKAGFGAMIIQMEPCYGNFISYMSIVSLNMIIYVLFVC